MMDEGIPIFVQSDDRRTDAFRSLKDRADGCEELKACYDAITKKKGKKDAALTQTRDDYAAIACKTWYDVRAFGQVFSFKKGNDADAVSIGIRGPVTIQPAFSLDPVNIISTQITKSVNLETGDDPDKKGADTMGMKHRVEFGVYQTFGSINVQTAQKTGFSEADAEQLKEALRTLFYNDATSARPDGSMEVVKLIWWEHNCPNGQYSAAKVHRSLHVTCHGTDLPEVTVDESSIPGLNYAMIFFSSSSIVCRAPHPLLLIIKHELDSKYCCQPQPFFIIEGYLQKSFHTPRLFARIQACICLLLYSTCPLF